MTNDKSKKTRVIAVLTVLCALITFVSVLPGILSLLLSSKHSINPEGAGSIGIIGGADGPTAIFLSGQVSFYGVTAVFGVLTILGIIYLVLNRYKENHKLTGVSRCYRLNMSKSNYRGEPEIIGNIIYCVQNIFNYCRSFTEW